MSPTLLARLRRFVNGQAIASMASDTSYIHGHPASFQRGNVLLHFVQLNQAHPGEFI